MDIVEINFGSGEVIVDAGTYGEKPAVFITKANPTGAVGEEVPIELQEDRNSLHEGSIVMTFPTEAQAIAVSNALVGSDK